MKNETDTNEHAYCGKNISKKVYIKKYNMSMHSHYCSVPKSKIIFLPLQINTYQELLNHNYQHPLY